MKVLLRVAFGAVRDGSVQPRFGRGAAILAKGQNSRAGQSGGFSRFSAAFRQLGKGPASPDPSRRRRESHLPCRFPRGIVCYPMWRLDQEVENKRVTSAAVAGDVFQPQRGFLKETDPLTPSNLSWQFCRMILLPTIGCVNRSGKPPDAKSVLSSETFLFVQDS